MLAWVICWTKSQDAGNWRQHDVHKSVSVQTTSYKRYACDNDAAEHLAAPKYQEGGIGIEIKQIPWKRNKVW